jgi:hypothetical protein
LNEAEEIFIKTFIQKELRSRWLTRLASDRTRIKQLNRLAHTFIDDLDRRYVYEKDKLPIEVSQSVQKLLSEWKKSNPAELCHVVSACDKDGEAMSLNTADKVDSLTFGAIIIIIPNKLAYYHTERSNLNMQPFYVLYHP